MDISKRFESLQSTLFEKLLQTTKVVNGLPAADLEFYSAMDSDFSEQVSTASEQLTSLTNSVLAFAGVDDMFENVDDIDDRFGEVVVDLIDNLLEKADYCIEDARGTRSKPVPISQQSAPTVTHLASDSKSKSLSYNLIHAQNILRPQLKFKDVIDNSSNTPWIRKIKEKPNAKVPLSYGTPGCSPPRVMSPAMENHFKSLGIGDAMSSLPHPYEYEINHIEYPERMYERKTPIEPKPFEGNNDYIWVDSEERLETMIQELEKVPEFAVDLEHHNYRSFQGFVCLMQISTRDADFLVDTLELREHLHRLNVVFTDPEIIKVLHGAESDILWLQRDFGVYVINMFDSYHATKVLEMPGHSLAYLLQAYCQFEADKKYQLADWRIRPLPTEMLKYARADTHFLLFIYDHLRNELLNRSDPITHNLMNAVLQRSAETALKRYEKESYDGETGDGSNGWRNIYSKWSRPLNQQQFAVFKAIHAWRDQVARDEDESVRYVLPNHMLFTLSEKMPTEVAEIIAACSPVPPLVKMNAPDLALVINRAKITAVTEIVNSATVHPSNGQPKKPVQDNLSVIEETVVTETSSLKSVKREIDGSAIQKLMATKTVFFGSALVTAPKTSDHDKSVALAAQIHATLSLSVPLPEDVLPEIQTENKHTFVPPENQRVESKAENPRLDDSNNVIVVSQQKKNKRNRESMSVVDEPVKKKKQSDNGDKNEVDKEIGIDDVSESVQTQADLSTAAVITLPLSASKKKKKKKKKAKNQTNVTSEGSPQEANDPLKPFDYASAHAAAAAEESKKAPKKEAKTKTSKQRFNPYGNIIESEKFKKREPRASSNVKNGNKSMTFMKPS